MADEFTTDTTQWAIADEGVYVENPEFIYVKTDKNNKILWAIKTDGGIYYGAGVPPQVIDYIEEKIADLSLDDYEDIVAFLNNLEKGDKTLQDLLDEKVDKEEGKSLIDAEYANGVRYIENPEFAEVKVDNEDRILEAIMKDGTKLFPAGVKVIGTAEYDGATIKTVENPEFTAVWLDKDERILFGVQTDGNFLFGCGIPSQIVSYIEQRISELSLDEYEGIVGFIGEYLGSTNLATLLGQKVDREEGKSLIDEDVAASQSVIEDPEGRHEITTDYEDKIISYRKDDGTLVENVGIESPKITTDSLNLSESGMTDFQQALKDSGFKPGGAGNFSDSMTVELPEPVHYALLNLIVESLPIENEDISEGYAEYYDKAGNYWKKPIELAAQGQTSRIFARTGGKGNYTLDIVDDSEIKFGSWAPQDSFHLKGCAKDATRGILATSYKYAWEMINYLDAKPNRVLKKSDSGITTTNSTGDRFTDWPDDARCLPDGFPCEIYINGEYWGLYSWQLKKHRKNYSMKKSDYSTFFLDADNFQNFWLGTIPWNKFEIKNPKDLFCMDGTAYDGDHPKELIDNTSQYYNPDNAKHVGSARTKSIIESFPTKYLEVKALITTGTPESIAEAKVKFNEYFDYNACIFVYIYNSLMKNNDSIYKNTLWAIYKDGKIAPMLWDLDGMYGEGWLGLTPVEPSAYMWQGIYATSAWPLSLLWSLYEDEIKAAYANLRRDKVISIETWKSIILGWINRIGPEAYARDLDKWPETPSYRKNYVNSDYWEEDTVTNNIGNVPIWDENTNYAQGDKVALRTWDNYEWCIIYTAKQPSIGVCPVTKFYTMFPLVGGYYNSPKRMQKWLDEQILLCDVATDYILTELDKVLVNFTAYTSTYPDYIISCAAFTQSASVNISSGYIYIEGYIVRHEEIVDNETISVYTIENGEIANEKDGITYETVKSAIDNAASQPIDVPSENIVYIRTKAKDVKYYWK